MVVLSWNWSKFKYCSLILINKWSSLAWFCFAVRRKSSWTATDGLVIKSLSLDHPTYDLTNKWCVTPLMHCQHWLYGLHRCAKWQTASWCITSQQVRWRRRRRHHHHHHHDHHASMPNWKAWHSPAWRLMHGHPPPNFCGNMRKVRYYGNRGRLKSSLNDTVILPDS